MTTSQNDLARKLKSFHIPGDPLLLANVWDGASAASIATHPSTKAIATASYAIAATQGLDDGNMTLDQNLTGVRNVVAGVRKAGKADQIPVSADLEDGYEDPAVTVRKAIELGVVGCNLEDVDNRKGELRSVDDAVARIRAAVATAREAGVPDFVVNARTDVLGYGGNMSDVVERGKKFLEAGATSVFVWGVMKWDIRPNEVVEMVKAFGGRLAVQPGSIGVEKLTELGVSRISVGPALWRKSMSVLEGEGLRLGVLKS
ncbi:hypothetical protein PMZ80_002114 [Knufia obscura]|uniref:Carboxyphosphonoenolpyruvate phosphonomutase-like protein n=2 Tax=Knufia TaxID=430999 RepID=A0AAN8I4C8_9EURO|nr:hypothetical protein PMZ80_002114 [Knufia obscura]KAK5953927.1 hypothetical protein OHC33_005198 [Knufia fluminis]